MAEFDDRWSIQGEDVQVTSVCVDWSVRLAVGEAGPPIEIRIESPIIFISSDGASIELVPAGDPENLAPILRIARHRLERLDAFKDGRLEVSVGDGTSLNVAVSDEFESWEIAGPRGFRIVSLPGGGISVWSATTE